MSAHDDMDLARWYAQEAADEEEYRFQQLRTREFTATITEAERAELDRMLAERAATRTDAC